MAGVKGRSGTNKGKEKPYTEALRRALARAQAEGKPHALDRIAEQHLHMAATGEMQAIKELADRLDGKPAQSIDMTGEVEHRYVARVPSKESTAEQWQQQHAPVQTQH